MLLSGLSIHSYFFLSVDLLYFDFKFFLMAFQMIQSILDIRKNLGFGCLEFLVVDSFESFDPFKFIYELYT
jgi:hypothetical protein